jgi:hypothetical protein
MTLLHTMAQASTTEAQRQAQIQAQQFARAVREHRSSLQSLANMRGGMCTADGWIVTHDTIDGDFELDDSLISRIYGPLGATPGPVMSATPPRPVAGQPAGEGPSALSRYLNPPNSTSPAGSAQRFAEEIPGVVYGPGNILGNSSAALAGALQGLGERTGRQALAEGIAAIQSRAAKVVKLGPNVELYNAAKPNQAPRVRLRVRQMPMTYVRSTVPTVGGPVTQWRMNGPGTAATLKAQGMTSQQMRNVAIMASEQKLPAPLRWSSGRIGGGVLAFGPSLAIDTYNSIETDLSTGQRSFNRDAFLVASAKSQSGNLVGLVGGLAAVALMPAAIAGAPLILIGLGAGIVAQLVWNAAGGGDAAEQMAKQALR